MEQSSPLKSAFSSWKMYTAILLGLGIASWMMIRSLRETHFTEVGQGKGTHVWEDVNHNKKVDFDNAKEFKLSADGNYRRQE